MRLEAVASARRAASLLAALGLLVTAVPSAQGRSEADAGGAGVAHRTAADAGEAEAAPRGARGGVADEAPLPGDLAGSERQGAGEGQGAEADEGQDVAGLPLARWREELELTSAQAEALEEVDAWLRAERRRLRAARGEGVGAGELVARGRALRDDLQAKLEALLTEEQMARIDLGAVFARERATLTLTGRGSGNVAFKAPFQRGRGDVTTLGTAANLQARIARTPTVALTVGVRGGATEYRFSRATRLDPAAGDPFSRLYSGRLSLGLVWQVTPRWNAFLSSSASTSAEEGARFSDSLVFGAVGGVSYDVTPYLALGLGVFFNTRLEADPRVFPLPIVRLRLELRDDLRLTVGVPQGLRLTYIPRPDLEISLTGGFSDALNAQDARLARDGFVPGGVLRQTAIPVGVVTEWRPAPFLRLSLEAGALVYRKLEIEDARGRSVTDARTEPSGYLSFGVNVSF